MLLGLLRVCMGLVTAGLLRGFFLRASTTNVTVTDSGNHADRRHHGHHHHNKNSPA